MAESGDRSAVRISQKRLTAMVAGFALIGSLALVLLWWDSTNNYLRIKVGLLTTVVSFSAVEIGKDPWVDAPATHSHISRGRSGDHKGNKSILTRYHFPLCPNPHIRSDSILIPIHLLILAYLATLLLIWIVQMNRLARRHFKNTSSIPAQD
jgi:hypothetical protein